MNCWYFSREKLVALQEGDRPDLPPKKWTGLSGL
jgi:hypothetical protein